MIVHTYLARGYLVLAVEYREKYNDVQTLTLLVLWNDLSMLDRIIVTHRCVCNTDQDFDLVSCRGD